MTSLPVECELLDLNVDDIAGVTMCNHHWSFGAIE